MSSNDHPGYECPQLLATPVYDGETEDATIVIEEVHAGTAGAGCIENGVAISVASNEGDALMVVEPEFALEVAAGIAEAAHIALMRREMGWLCAGHAP